MGSEREGKSAKIYPFQLRSRKRLTVIRDDVADLVIRRGPNTAEISKNGVHYTFNKNTDLDLNVEYRLGSYSMGLHKATASKDAVDLSKATGKDFTVFYQVLVPHPRLWSWLNPKKRIKRRQQD